MVMARLALPLFQSPDHKPFAPPLAGTILFHYRWHGLDSLEPSGPDPINYSGLGGYNQT
jgi:hypothetical protein